MTSAPNPYAPPGASRPVVPLPRKRWNEVEVVVQRVIRTWTAREVLLAGNTPAVLRYESSGAGERVFVNDRLAATTSVFNRPERMLNAVMDKLDFMLPYRDFVVPAQINVYVSLFQLLRITEFSLVVCEKLVHDDARRQPVTS